MLRMAAADSTIANSTIADTGIDGMGEFGRALYDAANHFLEQFSQ